MNRPCKILILSMLCFLALPQNLYSEDKKAGEAQNATAEKPVEKAPAETPGAANPANPANSNVVATGKDSPEKKREPAMASKPLALNVEGMKELEQRERTISEHEKEIAERERAVLVQEKILQIKLKRIEEVSQKMASRLDKFKEESESKVVKLVTMLETMKPDAAAAYVEQVDPNLAVEVMARINVTKAAKIWNKMDKKISARLTELYTGFRSRIDKEDTASPAPASTKSATSQPQGKG